MAIDYVLRMPCEVRKHFKEPQLVGMVRQMALAEFAVGEYKRQRPEMDVNTIMQKVSIQVAVQHADGSVKQEPKTVAELLASVAPLRQHKEHCSPCRANVSDRSFGCVAKINYPITAESEAWLLARLPADAKDPALSLLFKFIADVGVDGKPVEGLRSRPQMFASKSPAVRSWGGIFDKKKISSNQLLHLLFFGGSMIGAKQAALYTQLLGLETILSEKHPPSDQIEQFKTFFCAVVMAGRLDVPVDIDP